MASCKSSEAAGPILYGWGGERDGEASLRSPPVEPAECGADRQFPNGIGPGPRFVCASGLISLNFIPSGRLRRPFPTWMSGGIGGLAWALG